jgi:hypothetical protein
MAGVMELGGPSPPTGDRHELRNGDSAITTVESDAGVLLTASVDVVGAPAGDRDARGAAVFAARRTRRGNAAGT